MYGPPAPEMRQNLPKAFKDRFGIDMEYNGVDATVFGPRLVAERAGGVYSADALFAGSDTMYRVIAGEGKIADGVMGILDPLKPALVSPDVLDASKWRTGKLWFADPSDEYVLRMAYFASPGLTINTKVVPAGTITSWQDLLKPEWKGKIVAYDPTIAGSGLAQASMLVNAFGEDYVKKFFGEQAFLSRDNQQAADLLGSGSYPIAFALQEQAIDRLKSQGIPVEYVLNMSDGAGTTSSGYGMVGLVNKAPHPNAAKLFVNWIASQEGCQTYQESNHQICARTDVKVPPEFQYQVPQPGLKYLDVYDWTYVLKNRKDTQDKLQQALGRRG